MRRASVVLLVIAVLVGAVYLWPLPSPTPAELYAKVPPAQTASLTTFRASHPEKAVRAGGQVWRYLVLGSGPKTVVFLHGMTGSDDIWWQQLDALAGQFRVIAMTYPAVDTLEGLDTGVSTILETEGVTRFSVVGTSLGGYLAQYLLARHPERIERAVFANTFPPNDLIKAKFGMVGSLIGYLPDWVVASTLRDSFSTSIYPASGHDELTLAYLNELSYGSMTKAQVAARYRCVVEKFDPATAPEAPILIIQASNDPLVEQTLRDQLRATYPKAGVVTVDNGHFPYLGTPDAYTKALRDFLTAS